MTAICRKGTLMDLMEIMKAWHSVRRFTEEPLRDKTVAAIQAELDACNRGRTSL